MRAVVLLLAAIIITGAPAIAVAQSPARPRQGAGAIDAVDFVQVCCSGDCDGDGKVTVADIMRAVRIVLGTSNQPTCPCPALPGVLGPGQTRNLGMVARMLFDAAVSDPIDDCPP